MKSRALATIMLAGSLASPAVAQTWHFTPRISLTETWTDNLYLQPDALARSGWITNLVPSFSLEHRGPRLNVFADYRYQHDLYQDSSGDASRNYLRSLASFEAVEKRLWLEGRANITQERLSAFGAGVVPDTPGFNANRVETQLYSISPVVRGAVADLAQYSARASASALRAEGFAHTDTTEVQATFRDTGRRRIGWLVDMSVLRTRSDVFGTLDDRRLRAALTFSPLAQWNLALVSGVEDSDFAVEGGERRSTPGFGVEWSPSPRTQLAAVAQRRFFGTGHVATFRHRTPRTAWVISSRRDAAVLSTTIGAGAITLDTLMSDLLAAAVPEPTARLEAVRRRLAEFGAAPTSIAGGFLTERPFLNHALDATVAIIGVRSTVTLGAYRREQTALLDAPLVGDSFATSDVIRQHGFNAAWTYRLTRVTSLTAAASRLRTTGSDGGPSTTHDLGTLYLSTQLGSRTTASLGVRRVDFGSTRPGAYEENAVFGTVTFRL